MLEIDVVIIVNIVNADNGAIIHSPQQAQNEISSDESRRACYKYRFLIELNWFFHVADAFLNE